MSIYRASQHRVRAATMTLLLLVFSYLMGNILNVILTSWEYFDYRSLTEEFTSFYTYGVDMVSILTIATGCSRLPIYVTCMPQLKADFSLHFKQLVGRNKYKIVSAGGSATPPRRRPWTTPRTRSSTRRSSCASARC